MGILQSTMSAEVLREVGAARARAGSEAQNLIAEQVRPHDGTTMMLCDGLDAGPAPSEPSPYEGPGWSSSSSSSSSHRLHASKSGTSRL